MDSPCKADAATSSVPVTEDTSGTDFVRIEDRSEFLYDFVNLCEESEVGGSRRTCSFIAFGRLET